MEKHVAIMSEVAGLEASPITGEVIRFAFSSFNLPKGQTLLCVSFVAN